MVAPWQTPEWIEQMRTTLRPNAFLRMIENRWVSSESTFVDMAWWEVCIDPGMRPVVADRSLPIWAGVDASVKRDSTAIVACTWDSSAKRARLVLHRIFQPSPADPLDFEATIERSLLELRDRFYLRGVRFDLYQLFAVAQRLSAAGLSMIEFQQSVPNLTEASSTCNSPSSVFGRHCETVDVTTPSVPSTDNGTNDLIAGGRDQKDATRRLDQTDQSLD